MEICRVYRPRDPRKTPLFALLHSLFERVKGLWEERFEHSYGFWRGLVDDVVARYLDCGVWESGFARARCRSCPEELLVAFSCSILDGWAGWARVGQASTSTAKGRAKRTPSGPSGC